MSYQRGFTLLELLIGLTLLGLMLGLLLAGFRLAATSWDSVEDHLGRSSREAFVRTTLQRILTQILPISLAQKTEPRIAFSGAADRLIAVGVLAMQPNVGGPRLFELALEPDAQGNTGRQRLLLRQTPLRYDMVAMEDAFVGTTSEPIELLNNLEQVSFQYFGAESPDTAPRWTAQWSNKGELPRLIRLTLAGPQAEWPDVFAAPMISKGNCTLDLGFKLRCS